jgi:HEAT repeat protein
MAETDIQMKATDVLATIHTAIKCVHLYPPDSPMIPNAVEKLHWLLLELFEQKAPVVFAEAEKRILANGKVLDTKDQEKVHVITILEILLSYGLKSISFDKGLKKEEISDFIKIISEKADAVKSAGGLPRAVALKNIRHIYLDKKVYVAMGKDQKIISSFEITEGKSVDSVIPLPAEDEDAEGVDEQEEIINRLVEDMLNENSTYRDKSAAELINFVESLSPDQQNKMVEKLSSRFVEWIKLETSASAAYKKICSRLQELIQRFILNERFAEIIPIMDVFDSINSGALKKNDEIRKISLDIVQNLATENNLQILFQELNTDEKNRRVEASMVLARFGEIILNKLLNIVQKVSDSNERVRAIHLIIGLGQRAIPAIREHVNKNAPWYYLRNLAYIMGRIGDETHVDMLQPLLLHENNKVWVEAFKSISQIAGKQKGQILVSALPQVSDQLKVKIVEMLGKMKYAEAAPSLINLLKNKPAVSKTEQISLQEKVCDALGNIGSPEAIIILSEISSSKSFLGIRSYPAEIISAAKRALDAIKRKQGLSA